MQSYEQLLHKIQSLGIGEKNIIDSFDGHEISIFRPEKQFKNYDINKNFQIFIKTPTGREFRPNHLIIMIDLHLRVRGNPEMRDSLLDLFDAIFYHQDYQVVLGKCINVPFEHSLYDIRVITCLYLLLIAEQEYNYPDSKSKYNPKTLFLHGWIRQFLCDTKEIDNMVMSVCRGQPPIVKYTREDDMNHKKYNPNKSPRWYI